MVSNFSLVGKIFYYIPVLLLVCVGTAVAQGSGPDEEEDPFKNDPFFSKPIHEFFQKSSSEEEAGSSREEEVRYHVHRLNSNGIDFDYFIEAGPYNSNSLYSMYPNLPMIHHNRVDGLFLGLKMERMQWYGNESLLDIPGIQSHGLIGYGFARKEWQYTVGAEKYIGRRKYLMLGAEYHRATATDDYWRVGLTETTFTSFIGGYDFLDYYGQEGFGAYLIMRSRRYFEGGMAFADDRFTNLDPNTEWALFGSNGRFRANPPVDIINGTGVDTVNISSLAFSGTFNPKRLVLTRFFTLSLTGMVEFAGAGAISSDFSYSKYVGELISFVNFEPGGVFKYRLRMGSITGSAPNFKEFRLGGIGSLRALPYKSLAGGDATFNHYGNEMILSNAELQFGSPSFGSSDWIDFDNFYLSLFLDSGWVNYNADLTESGNLLDSFSRFKTSGLRHNGGVGIGSSLLRVEVAWDLEDTGKAPVLWIRLNPTF